jgi:hypothetical protein
VDWKRAAAILYGDWGTNKAYVIGLAFAVAGYASFWLIAAMCVLTALVGINYMVICRLYPDGAGVYAAVRHRSEVISIVGAFLLIADYLVTAAISALRLRSSFRCDCQHRLRFPAPFGLKHGHCRSHHDSISDGSRPRTAGDLSAAE